MDNTCKSPTPLITMRGVNIGYCGLIYDVDLSIPQNCYCVITGEVGVGKTSLLNCILGISEPIKGKIYRNPYILQPGKIGYLAQANLSLLPPRLKVHSFLTSSLHIHTLMPRFTSNLDRRRVEKLAHNLDLEYLLPKTMSHLSGGQLQLVFILHALLHGSRLLALDEPFNNLDKKNKLALLRVFSLLVKKHHVSILCISHDMSICDVALPITHIHIKNQQIYLKK